VEGTPERFVAWVAGARLAETENRTVVDPATKGLFPLEVAYRDGLLTALNDSGFTMEAMGAKLTFKEFRVAARLDADGNTAETPRLLVTSVCSQIAFYGTFLQSLGLCNAQTDTLSAFGAALLRKHQGGVQTMPDGVGTVSFAASGGGVTATAAGSTLQVADHVTGILLIEAASGKPVALDYGLATTRQASADGTLQAVTLAIEAKKVTGEVRAYLMVDTYPAARQTLTLP
jgi:hypothetical protein